jgi:hypothetical protein
MPQFDLLLQLFLIFFMTGTGPGGIVADILSRQSASHGVPAVFAAKLRPCLEVVRKSGGFR